MTSALWRHMSGAWSAATIACALVMRSASGTTWYSTLIFGCSVCHSARMSSYAFCSFWPPATWPMNSSETCSVVMAAVGWAAAAVVGAAAAAVGAAAAVVGAAAAVVGFAALAGGAVLAGAAG